MEYNGERDDDALDIPLAKAKLTYVDIQSTNTTSSQKSIPGEDSTEMDDPKKDACSEGDYALIIEDRMQIPLQLANDEPGEPGKLIHQDTRHLWRKMVKGIKMFWMLRYLKLKVPL